MAQRTLEVFLKYGMDERAFAQLVKSEESLRIKAEELAKAEAKLAKKIEETEKRLLGQEKVTTEEVMALVRLREQFDDVSKAAAEANAALAKSEADRAAKTVEALRSEYNGLVEAERKLIKEMAKEEAALSGKSKAGDKERERLEKLRQELADTGQAARKAERELDRLDPDDSVKGLEDLRAEAQRLTTAERQLAKEVEEARKKIARQDGATAENTEELERLERQLDRTRKAAREARFAMFDEMSEEVERSTQMWRTYADQWEGWGDILQGVGDAALAAGGSILALATVSTAAYVQKAGLAEKTSADWLATQGRLEQANLRIGRVTTSALLPTLEKVADLAEDAARFAEEHPEMVDAGIKAAGGLVLAGGLVKAAGVLSEIAGRGIRLYQDIREGQVAGMQLAASKGMNTAGDKMLTAGAEMNTAATGMQRGAASGVAGGGAGTAAGAAAAGTALAVVGGVLAGLYGYEKARDTEMGRQITEAIARGWQGLGVGANEGGATLGQYATVAAAGTKYMPGMQLLGALDSLGVPATKRFTEWVGKATGAIEKLDGAAEGAAGGLTGGERMLSQQAVDAYAGYRKGVGETWETYRADVEETRNKTNEERLKEEADYEKRRAEIAAESVKSLEKIDASYDDRRNKMEKTASKAELRANEDHLERIQDVVDDAEKSREETVKQAARDRERAEEEAARRIADVREQYQRAEERSREQFELEENRLLAAGDVLGLQRLREDRAMEEKFAKEDVENAVADEKEQADREAEEREEALEERLAEIEEEKDARIEAEREAYAGLKKERAEDLQERLDELEAEREEAKQAEEARADEQQQLAEAQHEERLAQIEQQGEAELAALAENRDAQLKSLEKGLAEQLTALDENLLGEQEAKRAYYARMTEELNAWLDQNAAAYRGKLFNTDTAGTTTSTTGGRAASGRPTRRQHGGYVLRRRLYELAENDRPEFVLGGGTTAALERQLGTLSQEKVLAALGRGDGGAAAGTGRLAMEFGTLRAVVELQGDGATRVVESPELAQAVVTVIAKMLPSIERGIRDTRV